MIIDASALLAILFDEPEAECFAQALADAQTRQMSAVNYLEAAIRIDREHNVLVSQKFDAFIEFSQITIVAVSAEQASIARLAYAEFGKGIHPAGLNFGDCFAYALAKHTGHPLLFKGHDFIHTDIKSAVKI